MCGSHMTISLELKSTNEKYHNILDWEKYPKCWETLDVKGKVLKNIVEQATKETLMQLGDPNKLCSSYPLDLDES